MTSHFSRTSSGGWTLLEMAVVLVIAALLAVVIVPMLPLGAELGEQELADQRIAKAQDALVGYARSHYRLPYADQDGDGREDIGALSGRLPSATLGLPEITPMGYGLEAELALAADARNYNPDLPVVAGTSTTAESSGLDFCVRLAGAKHRSSTPTSGPVNSAFAVSHRLPNGDLPASLSITNAGDGPQPGQSTIKTSALGMGELYTRLGCVERLPRAFAAAQSAQTAQSAYLLAEQHLKMYEFYVEVADLNRSNADVAVAFAAYDLASGLINAAITAMMAINDIAPPKNAFKVTVAIAQGLIVVAQITTTVMGLIASAEEAKKESDADFAAAESARDNAAAELERLKALRNAATVKARQLDSTGLNP